MTLNISKQIKPSERTWTIYFMLLLLVYTISLSLPPIQAQGQLEVTVESPQDNAYIVAEVIPIKIRITGLSAWNVTIDVFSHWDMQWVHVPLLYQSDNGTIAIYAPNPDIPIPKGDQVGDDLIYLNNMGYLRLPSASGEWWITLQVKSGSPYQFPIQREILVVINPQPNQLRPILLVIGFSSLVVVIAILIRRRIHSR